LLISSTVSSNHSDGEGGGLYVHDGARVALTGTDVTSNTAVVDGGGMLNLGFVTVTSSTIRANIADAGGGLRVVTGTLTMVDSTLSGNSAIGPVGNGRGGGLDNVGTFGRVSLVNSTVSGNQSTQGGGGLANERGTLDLSSVTLAGNTVISTGTGGGLYNEGVATATLRNTIVALNGVTSGQGPDCAGTIVSDGYNLVQSLLGCTFTGNTASNLIGQDPKLKPLGSYGGPTQTRDLLANSPALDAGNPHGCRDSLNNLLTQDQRGQARPSGPRCDIGAVEALSTQPWRTWLPLLER
jgi:hypothetical protein